LNILCKATGTALITLDAKDYKGGIISTSFTVQVDAPLPIDQDLKIAVKNISKSCWSNFCLDKLIILKI
jgi:hypothetical protein